MKKFQHYLICSLVAGLFLLSGGSHASACSFKPAFTGDTIICSGNNGSYTTTSVTGHYYRWVVSAGGRIVSGQKTNALTAYWNKAGTYSVMLVDSTNGCKDSISHKVRVALSNSTLAAPAYHTLYSSAAGGTYLPAVSGKVVTLTTASGNETTAAWDSNQVNLSKNLDITFKTTQNGAADGMMFVMQNTGLGAYQSSTSTVPQGSDLGYYNAPSGMMDQSIGIEEDIYQSTGYADSNNSHLNLVQNKNYTPIRKQYNVSSLGGGSTHKLRIVWIRDINLFSVYFDGSLAFSWPNDIVKNVFKGNPNVYFGFTGATGGSTALQTFSLDSASYGFSYVTSSKDTICSGDSIKLTATPGLSYSWSTGAKTQSIYVKSTGTYTVSVTDSFSCTSTTASKSVVVLSKPTASFTVSNACLRNYLTFTNTSSPSTGVKYVWKFGNGDSSTQKLPVYSYNFAGSYTMTLTVSNSGCSDKTSQSITAYPTPGGMVMSKSSPFTGQFNTGDNITPDILCLGDTNTYQFTCPKGLSNTDFGTKWTITGVTLKTPFGLVCKDTLYKSPAGSKNGTFRLIATKTFSDSLLILNIKARTLPGNCDTLITRYIQIRPKATSKFGFTNACLNASNSFTDSSTLTGLTKISKWAWDFGDGSTSALQNPKHTYSKDGSYKVTLNATGDAGCGIAIAKSVTVYPLPKTKFGTGQICQSQTVTFADSSSITSGTVAGWGYSFGDGGKSTAQNPTHTYAKSGPYKVKLVTISALGCKDSLTKSYRVLPKPVPGFNILNACTGSPVYIANTSTDSATGTTYLWDFGDGKTSTSSGSISHIYNSNGTYNIKLTVTSKAGCFDTLVKTETPNPAPKPNFGNTSSCTGKNVTFTDSGKNDASTLYSWTYGDGGSSLAKSSTATHSYKKAGTYNVVLTITNGFGCIDSEKRAISVTDFPKPGFSAPDVCIGKSTSFTNTSTITSGTMTYIWNFGDGSAKNTNQSPSHTFSKAGSYIVTLAVTSAGGCADTVKNGVNVSALPVVGPYLYHVHNYSVGFAPKDTTQKSYTWYFGTGDSSSSKFPVYTYASTPGKYQVKLKVTNATGCAGFYTDSVEITGTGISLGNGANGNITVYPNPFEGNTTISYTLPSRSHVTMNVYDMQGKCVATLKDAEVEAGSYKDEFDAKKYQVTEGVYLLKMTVNGQAFSTRIVNLK